MSDEQKTEPLMTPEDIKQLAHDYHVPMSEGTIKDMAKDMTPEKGKAIEAYVKTMAQGLFPTLAPQIKAGIPTAHLLEPYRQLGKQMLGDQFEPDFHTDPSAMKALNGNVDQATGRPAPMGLDQWRSHIMSDPSFGWGNTPAAHNMASQLMSTLGQAFSGGGQQQEGAM